MYKKEKQNFLIVSIATLLYRLGGACLLWLFFISMENPALKIAALIWVAYRIVLSGIAFNVNLKNLKKFIEFTSDFD